MLVWESASFPRPQHVCRCWKTSLCVRLCLGPCYETGSQCHSLCHKPGCHKCWEHECALLHPAFLGSGISNPHSSNANSFRVIEITFLKFYNSKWHKVYNLTRLNLEEFLINLRNWFSTSTIKGMNKEATNTDLSPDPETPIWPFTCHGKVNRRHITQMRHDMTRQDALTLPNKTLYPFPAYLYTKFAKEVSKVHQNSWSCSQVWLPAAIYVVETDPCSVQNQQIFLIADLSLWTLFWFCFISFYFEMVIFHSLLLRYRVSTFFLTLIWVFVIFSDSFITM